MPTLEHNGLVEMFRENPSLAPHILETVFHTEVPAHASVRVADSGLDQLIPVEFRADLVLELLDGEPLQALLAREPLRLGQRIDAREILLIEGRGDHLRRAHDCTSVCTSLVWIFNR